MKKRSMQCLAIAVCAVLLCGLAACNGGGDGKKQGKKKVTFWSEVNDSNQTLLTDAIKAFNDAHEDIQVTLVPQSTAIPPIWPAPCAAATRRTSS